MPGLVTCGAYRHRGRRSSRTEDAHHAADDTTEEYQQRQDDHYDPYGSELVESAAADYACGCIRAAGDVTVVDI